MATWNGAPTLQRVLEACCRLAPPPGGWSMLVVDDGSTDNTREVLAGFAGRLPLRFVTQQRRGKNAALNLALQLSLANEDAALYLFIDDDAFPGADWLVQMAQCAQDRSGHAVFGGTIAPEWSEPPPAAVEAAVPLAPTYAVTTAAEGPAASELVWGANMAVRRAVFDAGYRFDISLGTQAGAYAIGSDTELTRRLAAAGYACWFCPDAIVFRFIRRHQVRTPFILQRAWRVGRGAQLRGSVIDGPYKTTLLGLWRALGALARMDRNELLRQRWELAYLRGYLHQAWFGRGLRLTRGTRVLIASGSPQPGAVTARMAHAARLLAAAGCDASVATARFPGQPEYAQLLRDDGVYVSVFDAPRFAEQRQWRRTRQLGARLLAARRLRRYQSDLLHVAFGGADCASLLWLACHCKLPAVLSVHQALPLPHLPAWLVPTYAQAFGAVRGVHAVSPSAMASFMAGFGRFVPGGARLCVIPDSVDTERFIVCAERRAAARERLGLAEDSVVLGSMAPLEPGQRPEALVELFCALRNRFGQLRLVLSAAGALERALRAKVELLGLGAQVVFCSPAEALEHTLPALDLHLALGRGDTATILGAMACGVPAVALDLPGCSADILRASQGGVLLVAGDQRATIEAVGALVADAPRRAALALQARADIESNHTPELLAQRVRAFYAGLLP